MMSPVFGIVGWKNSGKTTLVERLVGLFASRGFRVATVKHAHHDFDIDRPGTDSHRHRAAGASETAIVSNHRWAIMHEIQDGGEPQLAEILARLSPSDLVLVEGYKGESIPKIECRGPEARDRAPLAGRVPEIVAIAGAARPQDGALPCFALDDVEAIAGFIVRHLDLRPRDVFGGDD